MIFWYVEYFQDYAFGCKFIMGLFFFSEKSSTAETGLISKS